MDIENVLKKVNCLNSNIYLVIKASLMTPQMANIAVNINTGGRVFDHIRGVWKPNHKWHQAILSLQAMKDAVDPDIFNFIIDSLSSETKPDQFKPFKNEWDKWCQREEGRNLVEPNDGIIELADEDLIPATGSDSLKNLLKVATYIQKSAITTDKVAQLISGHVQHVVSLINDNKMADAQEYIDVIRPSGWEKGQERSVDKIFELVVRELAKILKPEVYKAIGL
jgi:hypothetical protein